jgi:hypothetical protein
LSREGVFVAREAFQNIPGGCFSSDEYDDITMVQQEEPKLLQQSSHQLFGRREIILTSKFPAMENLHDSSHDPGLAQPDPHTINLGYGNQSQSFSAFDSKHVLTEALNQTPLMLHNIQHQSNISIPEQVTTE